MNFGSECFRGHKMLNSYFCIYLWIDFKILQYLPFYFLYSLDLSSNSSLNWCQAIVTINSYLIISNDLSFLLARPLPNVQSFLCFMWMDLLQQKWFENAADVVVNIKHQ